MSRKIFDYRSAAELFEQPQPFHAPGHCRPEGRRGGYRRSDYPTVRSASLVETAIRPIQEVAVCSPAFPALTCRPVALLELLDYPIISLGPDTKSFAFYSDSFTGHGLPFHPAIEAFTADQILPMVEANLGIGFVPNEFLEPESHVCRIDLKEQIPERQVVLITRKGQPLSMAAKKLERMILEEKSGN